MPKQINELVVRDCIKFMKQLPENSIDVIVTSPPYNIGKKYSTYKDNITREEYLEWMKEIAKESLRILKENGSFFLNIGGKPSDLTIPYDVQAKFREAGFVLQNDIIWVKSISVLKSDIGKDNPINQNVLIGHYKPINSKRYINNCHESIFHFTKRGKTEVNKLSIGVPYQYKSNIKRWGKKEDKRDRGDVWFIPYETLQESGPHPATFPVKLPEMCIKLHGAKKGLIVYDPFMGIGNTALACIELGVNYLGTDIDSEYTKIARKRIKEKTAQKKL